MWDEKQQEWWSDVGQRCHVSLSWKRRRLKRHISDRSCAFNGGSWSRAHHGRAPPCLPQLLCGDIGPLFLWLLDRSFRGQTLSGRCKEQRGTKYCTAGTFWEFLVYPQELFSGPVESHGIFGFMQHFKGEFLTTDPCCSEVITGARQVTFFLNSFIFDIQWIFINMQLLLIWKVFSRKHMVRQELLETTI